MKRQHGHGERDDERGRKIPFEQPQGDMENSRAHHGESESQQESQQWRSRKPGQSGSGHKRRSTGDTGTDYQNGDFDRNESQTQGDS